MSSVVTATNLNRGRGEGRASLSVREIDLSVEMPALVELFNRGFNMAIPQSRFDWLYCRNPDGPATAWFVMDDHSGEVAGCTAVFPRRVRVRGQAAVFVAWNCGDFCILPRYRAGGAAIKLRRAARDGVDAGAASFLYAHPNNRMLPIHQRVGHQALGRMIRLARPTRLQGGGPLARIGNLGLRAARLDRLRRSDDYQIESLALPPELDQLFEVAIPRLGTALVRDVRYLTWRFIDYPLFNYHFVLARRGPQLSGYLAYCVTNGELRIKDWLGADDRAVRTLFSVAIDQAFAADAPSASVTLLETHPSLRLLRSLGFVQRAETYTSITYAPESLPWRADVMTPEAWYMTVGDRDV